MAVGVALGWRPHAGGAALPWTVLLILAGTAAFSGLALLMAGTLRAEATLAAANLVYLVMLGIGGMVFPLTKFPAAVRPALRVLPPGALSDGLRSVLQHGTGLPVADLATLAVWAGCRSRAGGADLPLGVVPLPRRRAAALTSRLASCRRRPWC